MESAQLIRFSCHHRPGYTVEVVTDRVGVDEVVEAFRAFLLAAGFHPDSVTEVLGEQG